MRRAILFGLLLLFLNPLKGAEYELAICAIFQNEAKYLPEWIEFHEQQGVNKFYLYNNLSSDNYLKVLQKYIKRGLVLLINWPHPSKNLVSWNEIQCRAYNHCLERIRNKVKWCAFLDTDEFLFCPSGQKLTDVLKDYESFGGVVANWVCYGTSHLEEIPADKKMLECLVNRSHLDDPMNTHVKSIVKTHDATFCVNPHYFKFKNNVFAVDENFSSVNGPFTKKNSVQHIRINHYWTRDGHFFDTVKKARYLKWGFTQEKIDYKKSLFNSVYDPISNYLEIF